LKKIEDLSATPLPQPFVKYFLTEPLISSRNLTTNIIEPDFTLPQVDEEQLFIKIQQEIPVNGKINKEEEEKEKRKRPILDKEQKKKLKEEKEKFKAAWSAIVKKDIPKAQKQWATIRTTMFANCRKISTLCQKEIRKKSSKIL